VRGVFWTIAGKIAGNFDNTLHVVGVGQVGNEGYRIRRVSSLTNERLRGVCTLFIRVGAKKFAKEESAVPFSDPTQTRNQRDQTEAQEMADDLLGELFGSLDALILSDDAAEEDKRKELYAIAASVFA
jgi:hypothetical protein